MPTNRFNFTMARVASIALPATGQVFYWDAGSPGLGIRATPGSKSYVVQSKLHGDTIRLTIGDCATWKLPDVRAEVRRLRMQFDQGIDPRVQRAQEQAERAKEGLIVEDVWKEYIKAHNRWGKRHLEDHLWAAREVEEGGERSSGILRPLMKRSVGEIDLRVLVRWAKEANADHASKIKKGVRKKSKGEVITSRAQGRNAALRQGFAYFRALWRWAHGRPEVFGVLADPSMFSHSDLRMLIPKSLPKYDVLERSQLTLWFSAVRKISSPVISAYLQCLLLTGARRNEMAELKWDDVDLHWKVIKLKDKVSKVDGRRIPLSPYVESLLDNLKRESEWVFDSPMAESGHLEEPRIAHKEALEAVGLSRDLTINGLRRSFATLTEWLEMPAGVSAQIMGHSPNATAEKHYKRRPIEMLAVHLNNFEQWILTEANVPFDPDAEKKGVADLSKRRKAAKK